MKDEILSKVEAALSARLPAAGARGARAARPAAKPARATRSSAPVAAGPVGGVVLIGVSTGGPGTLEEVLATLPADFAWPVVIARHMQAGFTRTPAERLDRICAVQVTEASGPTRMAPGHVHIGRGGGDVPVIRRGEALTVTNAPADGAYAWHPSVTRLVASARRAAPDRDIIGVQLTSMGDDGAEEMAAMKAGGARTIAEDASTAVVFGMPQELVRRNGATAAPPHHEIGVQLTRWVGRVGADARRRA